MDSKPFEEVLGCRKGASIQELRLAYLSLAKRLHPDKNHGKESEAFLLVERAWSAALKREEELARQRPAQEYDLGDLVLQE